MASKKKTHIVFFTPSLHRTGSEIVLFNLLPFIKNDYQVTVVSKYKGELYDGLPQFVHKQFLYAKFPKTIFNKLVNRISSRLLVQKKMRHFLAADVWYINTLVLPEIVALAETNKIRTIVHLHELQQMYDLLSKEQITRLLDYPELIIANSKASAQVAIDFGRTKEISVCYPAIETQYVKSNVDDRILYRKKLGIDQNDFVWIMCGTIDQNKNPYLFIDLAVELKNRSGKRCKFVWLGGSSNGNEVYFESVKKYALEKSVNDTVLFTGHLGAEYKKYLSIADAFILTSQLESFSLVTLEALLLGLPIVANDCRGVREILNEQFGYVSHKKNDVSELALEMLKVMEHPSDDRMKQNQTQRGQEFDLAIWGNKWKTILNKIID